MGFRVDVKYYNSFWLKKTIYVGSLPNPSAGASDPNRGGYGSAFPGLPWNPTVNSLSFPTFPSGAGDSENSNYDEVENWFIEEARYQGGYNDVSTDYGAKAYLKEDNNAQEYRPNALIYSGVYNSRTGLNDTNVFSVGEAITKAADPHKGSVQKLHAEDTNLIIFQEDKVNRALIDKDQIYTSESGTQTLPQGTVIGQITPYRGEFGISKNPESFAVYGFRKYFADKDRGSILRLSHDGMTEISEYGMSNFFRDQLKNISELQQPIDVVKASNGQFSTPSGSFPDPKWVQLQTTPNADVETGAALIVAGTEYPIYVTAKEANYIYLTSHYNDNTNNPITNGTVITFRTYKKDKIQGAWDIYDRNYLVSIQQETQDDYHTLSFDEGVLGWPTFYSYRPGEMFSLKNTFFTTNSGEVYQHYFEGGGNNRNNFYGVTSKSSITFVFNPQPNVNKNFLTVGYEGSNGWQAESFISDLQGFQETPSNYVNPNTTNPLYVNYNDSSVIVNSYYEGAYDSAGNEYPAALTEPIYRAGFHLKEGKYVANLKSSSTARAGEVVFGPDAYGGYPTSGIKGFIATVKLSTDTSTDPGGQKQIFAASSNQVQSSN
jgi:hypothetical protein